MILPALSTNSELGEGKIQTSPKHAFIAMVCEWFVIHGSQAAEQRHVNSNDVIMDDRSVGVTQRVKCIRANKKNHV